jgi:hypothetical protein
VQSVHVCTLLITERNSFLESVFSSGSFPGFLILPLKPDPLVTKTVAPTNAGFGPVSPKRKKGTYFYYCVWTLPSLALECGKHRGIQLSGVVDDVSFKLISFSLPRLYGN